MTIVGAIAVPHPPLIVPAVGRGDQARIQNTIDAYEQATRWLLAQKPDCLVITSPHAPLFRDGFHVTTDSTLYGNMAQFRAPRERIHAECDVKLAREIVSAANAAGITTIDSDYYRDDMDHGTYVPLYFVREEAARAKRSAGATGSQNDKSGGDETTRKTASQIISRFTGSSSDQEPVRKASGERAELPCPIVRIGLSGLPPQTHRDLGRIIAGAAEKLNRRVGFIASGDLSHKLLAEGPYGFAPEGPVFDERIGEIFASGNLDELFDFDEAFCDAAAECGLRSFQIMVGAIDGLDVETRMLSNEGPFGVGYGVAICSIMQPTG